jgi:hypothetical protein
MFPKRICEIIFRRVYPDFCPGWLYATTPMFALELAEVASSNSDVFAMSRFDDFFITGFARERIQE